MARIILLNAHRELWFGKTLYFFLFRRPWRAKYRFFSELHSQDHYLFILCSKELSGINRAFELIHIKIWALLNNLNIFKVKLINHADLTANDIILIQYIGNFTSYEKPLLATPVIEFLNSIKCKKYLMMNHYPYHITKGVQNLKKLDFTGFILEADLNKGRTFYSEKIGKQFEKKCTVAMPFVVRDEFFRAFTLRKFSRATNTCLCVGTQSLDMSHDADFFDFFGHGHLQPLRKQIRDGVLDHLPLNNFVSHINAGGKSKSVRQEHGVYKRLQALYHNAFVYGQRDYHKMDIVDLFLSSNFHIVGEEVTGLPGIGAFEGMATGSILIGIEDGTYERFGMQSGVHYIGHDGTLESIERAIHDAIKMNVKDLSKMSSAAHEFVTEKCSGKKVYVKLLDDL